MWRSQVYTGTLRSAITPHPVTEDTLSQLIDTLNTSNWSSLSSKLFFDHDMDIIDTGLYLGNEVAARDRRFLQRYGFTHVLNVSHGAEFNQVDTNADYYKSYNIKYMGIPGYDRGSWNISAYFDRAADFIHDAITSGGKVLVHCVMGVSRSATIVIAYLMIYRYMSAPEALKYVFQRRRVFPNHGFLRQLAELDKRLRGHRHWKYLY